MGMFGNDNDPDRLRVDWQTHGDNAVYVPTPDEPPGAYDDGQYGRRDSGGRGTSSGGGGSALLLLLICGGVWFAWSNGWFSSQSTSNAGFRKQSDPADVAVKRVPSSPPTTDTRPAAPPLIPAVPPPAPDPFATNHPVAPQRMVLQVDWYQHDMDRVEVGGPCTQPLKHGPFPAVWNCDATKQWRLRCQGGVVTSERCYSRCTTRPDGADDECTP
jgi:hypothetical protein